MKQSKLQERFEELASILKAEMNPQGFWTGELSSSALAVAVAIAALHFHDRNAHNEQIKKGLEWLQNHINDDGGFGDTSDSPANVSTSLLVYAALNLYREDTKVKNLQNRLSNWLRQKGIDVNSPQVAEYILNHYKKDYTFSVPILTMCGLCNVPGEEAFKYIPQLPFELSLLPRKFYRILKLSVVSYAIPALIAVGIVVFKKKKSSFFWRLIRKKSICPSLALLQRLMPLSGGFLEAIPLTAFVNLSLTNSGFKDSEVVKKGIAFLLKSQREDGGWAIDIDLSTWVTTLSVKSLGSKIDATLSQNQQDIISKHLLFIQNKELHKFNGSPPGGWGWTNFPGSVPDGDDTPGAILALLKLKPEYDRDSVVSGCKWLLKLQNSDGGFPTFSKGWGKLPFDQSCTDLTGHGLLAISAVLETYGSELDSQTTKLFRKSFLQALSFLRKKQRKNGSWLPLWFGNQQVNNHSNPVYGTGKILIYLHDTIQHKWINESTKLKLQQLIENGEQYLISVQNEDGSWGGDKSVIGSIEETSIAVSALSNVISNKDLIDAGLSWLDDYFMKHGLKPVPIGLYFASLWYSEKMYPLTFYLEAIVRKLETNH